MKRHRILVIAHGHPDFSPGGGELAAYHQFRAYRGSEAVEDAWLLARVGRQGGPTGHIRLRRENEYLWEQGAHDWPKAKALHPQSLTTRFAELIRALKPTVVHAHHYAHLGLEYLRVIKQTDPAIRLYMTLHEYMAICANNGQMIKTQGMGLCGGESPDDCHACFPERSREDFWLRKHYFRRHFDWVDRFFAPSEFLRQRYLDWGLLPQQVVFQENGQAPVKKPGPRPLLEGESRGRFGFFGQITPYKGLEVVLEAMGQCSDPAITLEIHGANLERQEPAFREKILRLCQPLIDQGRLYWMGPYQHHELSARMSGVDWVIVPSIWWENSPLVIQEAFKFGRPVICSDIGGMAEKVRHGIDGMHFRAGNPGALSSLMQGCCGDLGLWNSLYDGLPRPVTVDEAVSAQLAVFGES